MILFTSLLFIGACSGNATDSPSRERIAAAAIDQFAAEFPRSVVDASTVVVPDDFDVDALAALLDTHRVVTAAPVEAGTYWEIIRFSDKGDYWQIDMSSVSGADFFSGSLVFLKTVDGIVEPVDPEDVGVTVTTSVS